MPPPLAPWLYPHHDDVLKGIQAFSSIREARNAADRLRMMRDQMDALATYRRSLIDQKAQQFRDAMTKFEDRNALLKQQNTIREKAADAVQALRDTRENERLDRLYQPKTTVGAHHAVTVYPDNTMDVIPLDTGTTKPGVNLVSKDVPGMPGWKAIYNENNPQAHVVLKNSETGETKLPTPAQMLTLGTKLLESSGSESPNRKFGQALIDKSRDAMGMGEPAQPAPSASGPGILDRIKTSIFGAPKPITVNPASTIGPSGVTPQSMGAPAVPAFEPAPLDVAKRVKGKTYMGKGGPGVWTGTGWAVPGPAAPAAAPVAPITTADLPVQLQDVPRDGLMGLPTFEPTGTDDIDELLKQLDMGDEEAE